MSASVFISFSSHDRKAAETICKAVEQRGLDCWISSRNIGPGENFQEAITRAIRSAKVMILVFSANANNSLEVKKEIALAGRYNVIVVPVRVEDVVPNDALSYELAVRQWIDLFDDWESSIERLVGQLGAVIQVEAATTPTGDRPAATPSPTPAAPATPTPATPTPAAPAAAVPAAPAPARPAGRRSWLPIAAAAAVVLVAVVGGAVFVLRPSPSSQHVQQAPAAVAPRPAADATTAPNGALHDVLAARLASAAPRLSEKSREDAIRGYTSVAAHKALAVPPNNAAHWQSWGRTSAEAATEAALEACQVQYNEPCVLTAVDDAAAPLGADGKTAARDMPRTHYTGEFDPGQIPGANQGVRERPDIVGYRAAATPKAAAYHPVRDRMFVVTGAASQFAAEADVLKHCNDDPVRNGAGGPCFLYAVENRVVLPLRLHEPMSEAPGAAAAAAQPAPPPATPQPQPVAAMSRPPDTRPRTFRDCPNCPEMAVVPAGHFEMGGSDEEEARFEVPPNIVGSERPRHQVTIAKPFALAKTEVTRGEFAAFVRATNFRIAPGCVAPGEGGPGRNAELNWQNPGFQQTDRDPVVCVNGADIDAYIDWLRKQTGKPYRLPSEAEFEYAARGGTTTPFYWGADPDKVCEYENVGDQTAAEGLRQVGFAAMPCRDGFVQTAPVASFKPNPFGLYDMIGNVFEMTADCWVNGYAGAPADGSARTAADCGQRAERKGSFGNGRPAFFRVARRFSDPIGMKRNHAGFRVALSLP